MRYNHLIVLTAAASALCLTAPLAIAQVTVTTSGGDVVQVSQKNLVDHMIMSDSLELEAAKLAVARTENAAVKEFATVLVTDHSDHLDHLHKLAGKHDIGREANTADTSVSMSIRRLSEMRQMPADPGFDRTFVRQQIMYHMHEIDALTMLRPAAKDDDLQKDIDRTMPMLQRHLTQAKRVGAQLGMSDASMSMPMTKPPTR
jgi:putative membrane protein